MADNDGLRVLPPGAGYGIVIGIGGVFAAVMIGLTYLQNRYTQFSTKQSEEFNTASRSVKPGLIAAGIVSAWTWSATLLTSSTFAYSYGIAIKIKQSASGAHTMAEICLARHGNIAHLTYLFNGLSTNMLVGACLVLGGSQVVAAISGMNVYAACFLIPLVVAAYVIAGGLRSTFIADYVHSVILFVAIFVFGFMIYATSDLIGSPSEFYDLLVEASDRMPIDRNVNGSFLTFRSVDGLIFGIDLFAAGFSTVWLDQAYWQRAIASRPETSVKAYILGGIAWYGIPFAFGTMMGLGCAALTGHPAFPTYPNPLSAEQNSAGLSSAATAIALNGKGGAILMLILLFMAVTSSTSAELIAVSSLLTFDVYKTYMKPDTSSAKLVTVSHISIVIYSLVLAAFCCILNAVGLNLTWLLTCLAIIVGGASMPIGLILLWGRMSTVAAWASPWISLACGLTAWFVTTYKRSGAINVATTGDTTNAVAGNITAWGMGALCSVVLTFAFPAKHVSTDPRHIERSNKIQGIMPVESQNVEIEEGSTPSKMSEKAGPSPTNQPRSASEPETQVPTGNEVVDFLEQKLMEPMDPVLAQKAERVAQGANIVFLLFAIILVPFTLFGTGYVYSKSFFTGWVVVSFMWVWVSMIICVIYPVVESRNALNAVARGVWRDLSTLGGKRHGKVRGGPAVA